MVSEVWYKRRYDGGDGVVIRQESVRAFLCVQVLAMKLTWFLHDDPQRAEFRRRHREPTVGVRVENDIIMRSAALEDAAR